MVAATTQRAYLAAAFGFILSAQGVTAKDPLAPPSDEELDAMPIPSFVQGGGHANDLFCNSDLTKTPTPPKREDGLALVERMKTSPIPLVQTYDNKCEIMDKLENSQARISICRDSTTVTTGGKYPPQEFQNRDILPIVERMLAVEGSSKKGGLGDGRADINNDAGPCPMAEYMGGIQRISYSSDFSAGVSPPQMYVMLDMAPEDIPKTPTKFRA